MRKFIIPTVIAVFAVANSACQVFAQDHRSMTPEKRDALIGQLETVLQQLQSERDHDVTSNSHANEVEGSLSPNESILSTGTFSSMGSYRSGSNWGGNLGSAYSSEGYPTGTYSGSTSSDYSTLPMESYSLGQTYQSAPVVQSAPIYQSAPVYQSAPIYESAPVIQQAPMTYTAPVETTQPVVISEPVVAPAPNINITMPPAPAPIIVVQQAAPTPAPAPSFGPMFMNYLPTPMMPMPAPRRHKCCLFGR